MPITGERGHWDAAGARCDARLALETIPPGSASPWRAHLLIALSRINQVNGSYTEALQNLEEAIQAGKLALSPQQ